MRTSTFGYIPIWQLLLGFTLLAVSGCKKSPTESPEASPPEPPAAPAQFPTVEGTLTHLSPVPNPKASPYRDCLFTAILEVESADQVGIPPRLLIAMPCFRDRTLTPAAGLETNQLIRVAVQPFADVPEPFKSMRQSDSVTDLTLPLHFAETPAPIAAFTGLGHAPSAAAAITTTTVPLNPSGRKAPSDFQTQRIANLIRAIEFQRDAHGGWDAWLEELAPVHAAIGPGGIPRFKGEFSIRKLTPLYQNFDPEAPHTQRMVQSLTRLRDGLAALGIDLIVAPTPSRDLVGVDQLYPDLRPDDGVWNPNRLRRNLHLLRNGIEFLDSTMALRAAAANAPHPLFWFDSFDGHPGAGATRVHGTAIADRLRADPGLPDLAAENLTLKWAPLDPPHRHPKASVELQHVQPICTDTNGVVHPSNPNSPILTFGDSYLRHPFGGGVNDVLSAELDHAVHSFVRPSGAVEMNNHLARALLDWQPVRVAIFVFDEVLLDPHKEDWVTASFLSSHNERQEFMRLSEKTRTLLDYNSPEDLALLLPREKPEGFQVQNNRAYIPYAAAPLHIETPTFDHRGKRPLLAYLRVRTRHPQPLEILVPGQPTRTIELNHLVNPLTLVLRPGQNVQTLTLRIPEAGGNLFIEGFKLYESLVDVPGQ